MGRSVVRSMTGVVLAALLTGALVPMRSHLAIATVGLILVIPVVGAVASGGYVAGVLGVAAGFLAYDFVFIPPYYTLGVGAAQNWVALGVYVVVMLLVARVVSRMQQARSEAQRRSRDARRLLDLSEILVTDSTEAELLDRVVQTVRTVFGVPGVALLVPSDQGLAVGAAAGEPLTDGQLALLDASSHTPVSVGAAGRSGVPLRTVALVATGRPVGLLVLRDESGPPVDESLLRTFANQSALAIERAQLRSQALKSEILEESDRIRRALLGAVSHDLRTPLSSMKVAASTLLESQADLDVQQREELYRLIDMQTDRLDRLVTGLLDLNRYQAGVLALHHRDRPAAQLVLDSVQEIRTSLADRPIVFDVPDDLPEVRVDDVVTGQVFANLLDNADRYAPGGGPLAVGARAHSHYVQFWVDDGGPGVPLDEHDAIFESFVRSGAGGRAGLGWWICKAFVEAQGGRIWTEDAPGGGARFAFTLPIAVPTLQPQPDPITAGPGPS